MAALTLNDVDVLDLQPLEGDATVSMGQWPCPFCGNPRNLDDGYSAKVRNRTGAGLDRWVMLCADCAAQTERSA